VPPVTPARSITVVAIGAFAVLTMAAVALVLRDVASDRRLKVEILRNTPVYAERPESSAAANHAHPIAMLFPGTAARVARVRYGKDVMAIRIEAARVSGWVVYQSGGLRITLEAPN
jgi:hypothetical protein